MEGAEVHLKGAFGLIQVTQDAYTALAANTVRAEVKSEFQRKIDNLMIPTGWSK